MTGQPPGLPTQPPGDTASARQAVAFQLRPMVAADLPVVIAVEHELFPDDAWSPEMFAEEVAQPTRDRLYLVAESRAQGCDATALVGYAGIMFAAGATYADVLTIAVRQHRWGGGIGSALLAALLTAAREHACTEVFLEVRADNPRAQGLYLRRGFVEIGVRRGYYQPSGMDAIVMRKDLSS
jgi:ribosomal-protein-alanine N-acetyltransferase